MKDKIIQRPTVDEISYCELDANDRNLVEQALKAGFFATPGTEADDGHRGDHDSGRQYLLPPAGQAVAATPKKGGKVKFSAQYSRTK